jgi:hypothetical protein
MNNNEHSGVLPHDPVNHPSHYTNGSIECIDAIEAALGPQGFIAYCRGNAIKYTWRATHKQNPAEDLRKAAWYTSRGADAIDRFIATVRDDDTF